MDQAEGHAGIPTWYSREQMKEYLAAKMVGRWRDGTSLVKHPHKPGTGWNGEIKDRRPDNVIGGEYFFLPSRSALTFLGHQAQSSV